MKFFSLVGKHLVASNDFTHEEVFGRLSNRKNEFAVTVYKNWRMTFEFQRDDVINVNLEGYH